jgi:hypothetical protein
LGIASDTDDPLAVDAKSNLTIPKSCRLEAATCDAVVFRNVGVTNRRFHLIARGQSSTLSPEVDGDDLASDIGDRRNTA